MEIVALFIMERITRQSIDFLILKCAQKKLSLGIIRGKQKIRNRVFHCFLLLPQSRQRPLQCLTPRLDRLNQVSVVRFSSGVAAVFLADTLRENEIREQCDSLTNLTLAPSLTPFLLLSYSLILALGKRR